METLRVHINDKIKDNSIEFKSLVDEKKLGSFQMQNLVGFNTLGNKRKKIKIARDMEFILEDFKILEFENVWVSNGGGYSQMIN
ncbi:hypothetical protein CCY99_04760 [Helicobacter sp. 16-1353]|uniref:hypothetical protein n=1 Tax=Helicobacter sp. 16-1353 TaxID=2004996 RepID=UPI000DCECEF9|nr:hypothetical protein [Helicobacter sp. 16-1353]RAX53997.1 hypothetical protein CCY99_04760 [Helicobacter sp. 16-1353]